MVTYICINKNAFREQRRIFSLESPVWSTSQENAWFAPWTSTDYWRDSWTFRIQPFRTTVPGFAHTQPLTKTLNRIIFSYLSPLPIKKNKSGPSYLINCQPAQKATGKLTLTNLPDKDLFANNLPWTRQRKIWAATGFCGLLWRRLR